jgi:chlorite dismutase
MTPLSRCLAFSALSFLAVAPWAAAGEKPVPDASGQRVEVAFVLDTTGSMASLIDGAKKKIWSIANAIVDQNPDAELYFGLVGYRDLGDDYVTKKFPLTTDLQGIYASLLAFRADGGGDAPESVNEALDVAVTQLGWSDKGQERDPARRILFLVGDAPPHMDYKQDRKYPEVIREAVARGIVVNTVQAGNMQSTTRIWREMARLGHGDYHAIPQDGGRVVIVVTPFDERIREIQIRLNKTVIPYGSRVEQSRAVSKTRQYEAEAAPAAEIASFVNKRGKGGKVITGGGDLVDAVNTGKARLGEISAEELPPEMQKMSAAERERYVAERNAEREKLSGELGAIVLQRDAYLKEQSAREPAKADSFDRAVKETLKRQAGAK